MNDAMLELVSLLLFLLIQFEYNFKIYSKNSIKEKDLIEIRF